MLSTCPGERPGLAARTSAATPDTTGAAALVPLKVFALFGFAAKPGSDGSTPDTVNHGAQMSTVPLPPRFVPPPKFELLCRALELKQMPPTQKTPAVSQGQLYAPSQHAMKQS